MTYQTGERDRGVKDGGDVAADIVADWRRAEWASTYKDRRIVLTAKTSPKILARFNLSPEEVTTRTLLIRRARTGDADAQHALWIKYRCRVWPYQLWTEGVSS